MKRILFAIFVITLFIVGCTPQSNVDTKPAEPQDTQEEPVEDVKETVVEQKEPEPAQPAETETAQPEETDKKGPEEPEEEPTVIVNSGTGTEEIPPAPLAKETKTVMGEMDEEVAYLLGRADEKITSYQFTYAGPPQNLARDVWYIKGTRIKVDLFDENWVTHDEYIDTIYIDTAKKTAVGYCQSPKTVRCMDPDKQYPMDYEEVMITTPYQWVKKIPEEVEKVSTEMLWDRKVTVLKYTNNGKVYKQWVDNFAGLPVKVQEKEEGKDPVQWDFRYLAVNSVSDEDLEMKRVMQLVNEN